MIRLALEDVLNSKKLSDGITNAMKSGSVFIYPTDTVYGIGCNAEAGKSVARIRSMKGTDHPFSVIAPSLEWIKENLAMARAEYMKKLPGPYTLIFKKKSPEFLSAACSGDSLGVRMPDHPFSRLVSDAGVPFVTTSANVSGQPAIRKLDDAPGQLSDAADFCIDGGTLAGRASTVIDLTGKPRVIRK